MSDENSENGYRTVTMQEELEDLDSAYERIVNRTVSVMKQSEKAAVAFDKYYAKLQRIGAERAEMARAYADRRDKIELVPEDAVEKMISEREAWKMTFLQSFASILK